MEAERSSGSQVYFTVLCVIVITVFFLMDLFSL